MKFVLSMCINFAILAVQFLIVICHFLNSRPSEFDLI
jgi:hypothetical protein